MDHSLYCILSNAQVLSNNFYPHRSKNIGKDKDFNSNIEKRWNKIMWNWCNEMRIHIRKQRLSTASLLGADKRCFNSKVFFNFWNVIKFIMTVISVNGMFAVVSSVFREVYINLNFWVFLFLRIVSKNVFFFRVFLFVFCF